MMSTSPFFSAVMRADSSGMRRSVILCERRLLAPEAVEALVDEALVGHELGDLVGAGADRLEAERLEVGGLDRVRDRRSEPCMYFFGTIMQLLDVEQRLEQRLGLVGW